MMILVNPACIQVAQHLAFLALQSTSVSLLLALTCAEPRGTRMFQATDLCRFSQVFPDYRSRVLSHEGAHFLLGYLLGCPVVGYDLTIGAAHIDFAEAKLQKRLFLSKLSPEDVDQLGVISMAGVAAEAMNFEDV